MTGPNLESWFENWHPTSVKVERASLLRYEKSISVTSAILISEVQLSDLLIPLPDMALTRQLMSAVGASGVPSSDNSSSAISEPLSQ